MDKVWLVFIGGGIGATTRYGTNLLAVKLFGTGFPWGTLVVNLAGCLLIGVSLGLSERSNLMPATARLFFVTGFLGGLTTFSSYALESVVAARTGTHLALSNILLNNLAGLALVLSGLKLTQWIL